MLRLLLDNGSDIYTLDTERVAIMKQELIGNIVAQVDTVDGWYIYMKFTDGKEIEVCTNNIAYAINYLQNKNGLLEEMSFTRC